MWQVWCQALFKSELIHPPHNSHFTVLFLPFYSWGQWGSERLSDFSKDKHPVVELVSDAKPCSFNYGSPTLPPLSFQRRSISVEPYTRRMKGYHPDWYGNSRLMRRSMYNLNPSICNFKSGSFGSVPLGSAWCVDKCRQWFEKNHSMSERYSDLALSEENKPERCGGDVSSQTAWVNQEIV